MRAVLLLCRKVLLGRQRAVDLLQDVLGAAPIQHQDGQVPLVRLVDHLAREGMANVRRQDDHEAGRGKDRGVEIFLAVCSDTDAVGTVSYTHLTLPTIYSV